MLLENNPYPQDVRVRHEARSLIAAGYRVTVVCPRGGGQARRETVDGVEVRRFRLREAGGGIAAFMVEFFVASLVLQLAALRALARGAAIVHLHNPPDTLFAAGWAARLLRRRVVFDHHDLAPELVAVHAGPRAAIALARWCERRTYRVASLVVATNDSVAENALARGSKARQEVVVVRNGPPAASLSAGAAIRTGPLSDPRLVYVGALAPQDDARDLATVVAALRDRHGIPFPRLTVVGDGPAAADLIADAERLGVADLIEITGWVAAERVPEILRTADICIDPARPTPLNDSSTMIKIAEYLAAGRPVVAHELTETKRTAAEAACLVPGADPAELAARVAELAADEQLRAEMAARARRRAPELVWEVAERQLLRAYEALCA